MPTTDDKLFIQNEKGEVYPIELHYRMVSEAAKKVEFEFDGHMSETKLIANYTRVAPWAMRDLFPCRYKADRWIKRAKNHGRILRIKHNFESWTRGMKVNKTVKSYLIREAIKYKNEPLKIEFFEEEDINKIRSELYFHKQIKTTWF